MTKIDEARDDILDAARALARQARERVSYGDGKDAAPFAQAAAALFTAACQPAPVQPKASASGGRQTR